MAVKIDRRTFVVSGLAATALPALSRAQELGPEGRRLFDAVTGEALSNVKIIVKKVGGRGRWTFRTDDDGNYQFGKITASLTEQTLCRVRIKPTQLRDRYIGFEGYWTVYPGMETNPGLGDIGLIPLTSGSLPFSFSDAYNEAGFRGKWLMLLRQVFFSIDRQSSPRPKQTAAGALNRFAKGEMMRVRVSDELAPAEYQLVRRWMGLALKTLTKGVFAKLRFSKVPAADTLLPVEELPPGTVTVTRRDDFPRPAARIRYGNTNPYDVDANPNEILAAQVILDTYTLDELYKQGNGDGASKNMANHLVQRCTAYALGWRPTLMLLNASVVDENYGPPGEYMRRTITPVDKALIAAVSGGGSGCYAPGTRLSRVGLTRLIGDSAYPLTPSLLT